MKKSLLLMLMVALAALSGQAASDVAVDETNFPDSIFRNWVSTNVDTDHSGYLSDSELSAVTSINLSESGLGSVKGVEYFTGLTYLNVSRNNLTTLDVRYNSKLKSLYCDNNQLTSLGTLPYSLEELYCGNNSLSGTLGLSYHGLQKLSVSNNTDLASLICSHNYLTELDVSGCTAMTTLSCDFNQLTSLSSLPGSLQTLNCNGNELTSLPTLPGSLKTLYCAKNKFTRLTISGQSNLQMLDVASNTLLTSLNASNTPSLTTIEGYRCALTSLDVSGCSTLRVLNCYDNQLTSLNVQNLSALKALNCDGNQLSSLSVQGTSLTGLHIARNNINGDNMTALINSMRTIPSDNEPGSFYVFLEDDPSEGNAITDQQIRLAQSKNWTLYKHQIEWVELTASSGVRGDLNGDGLVDVSDVSLLIDMVLGKTVELAEGADPDLVSDGNIDVSDVSMLIDIVLGKDVPQSGVQTFTVNGVTFKMVKVKGGTFTMGATAEQSDFYFNDELPTHQVTLSDYSIGETEVTQELWQAVMGYNPSYFNEYGNPDYWSNHGSVNYGIDLQRPVENVSWNDCQTFITKLNEFTGKTFRLPTEAEWEYAARGGNKSQGYKYAGSNTLDDVAWCWVDLDSGTSNGDGTRAAGTKAPNELGLYDMSGNVVEWCQDRYGENYYSSSPSSNPTGPSSGSDYVARGGSLYDNWSCRVSARMFDEPTRRVSVYGLRLAL